MCREGVGWACLCQRLAKPQTAHVEARLRDRRVWRRKQEQLPLLWEREQ